MIPMSLKRKLPLDLGAEQTNATKRATLVQHVDDDTDVVMSEPFHDDVQDALKLSEESVNQPQQQGSQKNTISIAASSRTHPEYASVENSPTSSPFYPDYVLYPSIDIEYEWLSSATSLSSQ